MIGEPLQLGDRAPGHDIDQVGAILATRVHILVQALGVDRQLQDRFWGEVLAERTLGLGQNLPLLYRPHPRPAVVLDADPVLAARVHGYLERAEAKAGRLITENRKAFDTLVEALIDAQALDGADVVRILDQAGVASQCRFTEASIE